MQHSTWLTLLWLSAALLASGCDAENAPDDDTPGDDDTGDDDDDDDDTGPGATAFIDDTAGRITVSERYNYDRSLHHKSDVHGQLNVSPDPAMHHIIMEEGECRYLEVEYGYCDPPCGQFEVCTTDDVCQPFPTGVSAGILTISGLAEPVVIEPQSYNEGLYYGPFGLPEDLFETGATVTAEFAGDVLPAMTLDAVGVEPIDTDLADDGFVIVPGQANVFTWTPGPDPEAGVQVRINSVNIAHGMPLNDIIWCVGPDDGELIIPQEMVDYFPLDDIPESCTHFDCPPSELTRLSRDTVDIDGSLIELMVHSSVYFMGGVAMGK